MSSAEDHRPRGLSLSTAHVVLFAAAIVSFALALIDRPMTAPWPAAPLTYVRVVIALPVILLVPGLALAPALFGAELGGAGSGTVRGRWDAIWTLTAACALAMPVSVLHVAGLRLLGIAPDGPVLAGLLWAEAGIVLVLRRRKDAGETLVAPSGEVSIAWLAGLLVIAVGCVYYAGSMTLDSSHQVDFEEIDRILEDWHEDDTGSVSFTRAHTVAERFRLVGDRLPIEIVSQSSSARTADLLFLVHGPRGFEVELTMQGADPQRVTLKPDAPSWLNAPYGVLIVRGSAPLPGSGATHGELIVTVPDGVVGPITVQDLSGLGQAEILRTLANEGVYGGSLGTIVEFDTLARVLRHPRGHPEWSLAGSDLGIPPGFVHLSAVIREVASPHTVAFSLLLLLLLAAYLALTLRAVEEGVPRLDPLLGIGLGCIALQHMHAVYDAVQYNFADNWYTLALCASLLALGTRRPRLFATWAVVALATRYPGAVVAGLAGVVFFLFIDRPSRAWTRSGLLWLTCMVVVMMAGLLTLGLVTGEFALWIGSLSHETWGEHYEQNPGVPLLERASEFLAKWGAYGGLGVLFAVPLRGSLSRLMLAAVVVYAPMLIFIDHFANHYILPLMALFGVAVAANLARWAKPWRRRAAILAWAAVVGVLVHPEVFGRVYEALLFH